MLTSRQRAFLKGHSHDLKPVVLLGQKGITQAVLREVREAVAVHELIKVRLVGDDAAALQETAETLVHGTGAELVARIGKVALLFAPHPQFSRFQLPGDERDGVVRSLAWQRGQLRAQARLADRAQAQAQATEAPARETKRPRREGTVRGANPRKASPRKASPTRR
jgi:RNA-binding protein